MSGKPISSSDLNETTLPAVQEQARITRRKEPRFQFLRTADWDFFTSGTGAKKGFLENISSQGCLLRTCETIEHRRWIRLIVKQPEDNMYFTVIGRVIRREDRLESWDESNVTLYRYGVEFVHQLNPVIFEQIKAKNCTCAGCKAAPGTIPDLNNPGVTYCVLCHLRQACQSLIIQDGLERA